MQDAFRLSQLLLYDDFTIQCHNFPDADAIASEFAVYTYLVRAGKRARIVYGGSQEISKPNLVKMVELLGIPILHTPEPLPAHVLIMVDCQRGQSNATHIDASHVYVIDHHEDSGQGTLGIIRSQLGSCAALVWDLLKQEGFVFDDAVATALYYGLYTDTSGFDEIGHPTDKDMRDGLNFNKNIIDSLRFNNLTLPELSIVGEALVNYKLIPQHSFAMFEAKPCDPNILGLISDVARQAVGVDVCVVYAALPGGHKQKAGGFIPLSKAENISEYISERAKKFINTDMLLRISLKFSSAGVVLQRATPSIQRHI